MPVRRGVIVGGDQVHRPTRRPPVELADQRLGVVSGPFAGNDAHDQGWSGSGATWSQQSPLKASAGSSESRFFSFLATMAHLSANWTARVQGGRRRRSRGSRRRAARPCKPRPLAKVMQLSILVNVSRQAPRDSTARIDDRRCTMNSPMRTVSENHPQSPRAVLSSRNGCSGRCRQTIRRWAAVGLIDRVLLVEAKTSASGSPAHGPLKNRLRAGSSGSRSAMNLSPGSDHSAS